MARRYSPKVKFQIVLEVLTGEKSVAQIARAYGIHPNSVSVWRRDFLEKGPELFAQDNESKVYEGHITKLERLLGQKGVEIALPKTCWAGANDHRRKGSLGRGGV